ncbi:MAG TPA: cyclic peptide export ABC transporter [Pyrinomonadaceae bacterium]|nr:cyclic peptide export ABC transporter [Pyrinomonadaceae bacterium]
MELLSLLLNSSRRAVVVAALAGVLSGIASTGLIAFIHTAVSRTQSPTALLVWGFAALCAGKFITAIVSELLLIRLSQRASFDLRMHLSRRIAATPLRRLEELGAHRLLASLTDDVLSITNGFILIPILLVNIAIVVGCLIYLGWLSWIVLLVVALMMAAGIVSYQLPVGRAMRHLQHVREEQDALLKHFRALIEGVKELKLHPERREEFLSVSLTSTADALKRHFVTGMSVYAVAGNWGHILFLVFIGLLLFALPNVVPVDAPTLTGYVLTILYLMSPLEAVLFQLPTVGRAQVALRAIRALGMSLSGDAEEEDAHAAADETRFKWSSLELAGVTHSYRNEQDNRSFQLGPIDFRCAPGELIFITGGNGSGKTTLVKLLTGLYTPEAGEIRLDGAPVTDRNQTFYRRHFSAVFSDFYVFESLLGLGAPDLDARAHDYLVRLQLDRKVQISDGKLSTVDLSQGQRKRLALLTAYLEDRPIYVFDEWAADQDPVFKEIFYLQLLPELKARGKTVLVISHDDRYYHVADRIIKLNYGQVESDTLAARLAFSPESRLEGKANLRDVLSQFLRDHAEQ